MPITCRRSGICVLTTRCSPWARSQDWQARRTHSHPEFPATVVVGPHVNSWIAPPNVEVAFDAIVFSAP